MMRTKRPDNTFCSLLLCCALGLLGSHHALAQEPADQDKTGQGATGHKKPLDTAPEPTGKPADNAAKTPAPAHTGKGAAGKKADASAADHEPGAPGGDKGKGGDKLAYDFELPGPDGKGVPLASFKGKVLLIVNLARNSSYNSQVPALEKLSQQFKDKGLVVIGVPSNDFGAAEPGTDPEIQKVYKTDDKVTFPIMARSPVVGNDAIPFYGFLTKGKAVPEGGPVHWNYTKFLIDKTGKVVARFDPEVAPDSPELLSTLEQVLSGRFKPKKAGPGGGEGGDPPAL